MPWWYWRAVGPFMTFWPRVLGLIEHVPSYCPWCGFDDFDPHTNDEERGLRYEVTRSGSYPDWDGTRHWVEGIQHCPRCRYRWRVFVSD